MRSPSPAASLPTSVTSASTATASISFGPEHLALLTPVSLLSLGSLAAFHLLQQLALSDPPTHVGFVHAKYHLPLDREGRKNTVEYFRLLSLICTGLIAAVSKRPESRGCAQPCCRRARPHRVAGAVLSYGAPCSSGSLTPTGCHPHPASSGPPASQK